MADICSLTLCQLEQALRKKDIGVKEAVAACLERIDATEPKVEALLAIDRENAIKLAEKMDDAGPRDSMPLWGVPVTVKDALSTKGLATTAASRILENFVPIYDAFVVRKLREAGAIILGKNNMDEFAMGSSTENSAFKKTRNPWDLTKTPGGSSGGSAASVACGQCFASLGSDTGGSIRQPASFCGCAGLKPTYGRVSRYGLFAFGSSLDQVGPICRSVQDCAIMLNVISGHDPRDNTSSPSPQEDFTKAIAEAGSLAGARIGYPENFSATWLDDEVRAALDKTVETAKNLGAEIIGINLPDPQIAIAAYYIIAMAEASSNLARYDGARYGKRAGGIESLDDLYLKSRSQGFGQEVKRRIMLGSYVLSSGYYDAYFKKAAQTRRIIHDQYMDALKLCDMICMPVAPATAWKLGSHDADPLQAYLMDAFTLPVNLAGLPALALPTGLGATTGMPAGIQLVGRHFGEAEILRCGHILEQALPAIGRPQV